MPKRVVRQEYQPADVIEAPAPAPADPMKTDEGVPFAWIDHETITNLSTDVPDNRRPRLFVGGIAFEHVGGSDVWTYRHDR